MCVRIYVYNTGNMRYMYRENISSQNQYYCYFDVYITILFSLCYDKNDKAMMVLTAQDMLSLINRH